MAMALGHVLVLRAAIVPSTALRTAALGALAESPVMGAGYALHRTATDRADLPAPGSIAASLLVWALMTIATTSVISAVIFGLRQRIRQVSKLGQYALEAKIGEGGMGVVYRARHALLRRPTAVKLLSSTRTTDLQLARFEREVQATARLSHPNIVAIYDYGRSERGLLYYAMEYVDGIDLERLVRAEGALPDGRVLAIVRQAAEALAEAHQAGLVHRDVKPSNIILCRTARHGEQVKLVDFGLVKESTAGNTQQSDIFSLKGTPLYMAPEAIRAPETVDFRSDLYSLGAVGYFLLTGVPVFDAGSALEVYSKHLHEPPTPPSQRLGRPVATALEREILACLHKAPENRPQSADALLERVAEAGPQCEPFTAQDARRWWADRAPEIRRVSSHPSARSPASDRRLVVDAGGRT